MDRWPWVFRRSRTISWCTAATGERYAWIKGRVITGDRADELAAIVTPFVFRRYLDFGAIRVPEKPACPDRARSCRRDLDDHVKLGPGGIREIEFIAQAMQIIRGGRDTALRVRLTIAMLGLRRARTHRTEAVAELRAAYDYLRRVEHRLQYAETSRPTCFP